VSGSTAWQYTDVCTTCRHVSGKSFYHLRHLKTVRRSLSEAAANTMVHAFITSWIDYCNSVLHSVSAVHLRPLQNVLSSAARIILRKQRLDHITADIRDLLHWLPVNRETSIRCVCSYISVHISLHPSTSPSYASQLQQTPVGVIYVQQCKATSSSLTVGQSDMDKEVLPIRTGSFELTPTDSSWSVAIHDSVLHSTKTCYVLQSTMIHSQCLHDSLGCKVCANINVLYIHRYIH